MGACHSIFRKGVDANRFKGRNVEGLGGELEPMTGRVVCLMVCFDYKNPACQEKMKAAPLNASKDGKRFGSLVKLSKNAELIAYFDGAADMFPRKNAIVAEWRRLAKELGEDDVFIFYFSGHGVQTKDKHGDEEDGLDECLLFTDLNGKPILFTDDEISELLTEMNPATRVMVITDCCHCSSACDLDNEDLHGRQIFHMAAALDHEEAIDLGGGGAFTTCILETVKKMYHHEHREYSITEVYNTLFGMYQGRFAKRDQHFEFSFPPGADPDRMQWPLHPTEKFWIVTPFDGQLTFAGKSVIIPGLEGFQSVAHHLTRGVGNGKQANDLLEEDNGSWQEHPPMAIASPNYSNVPNSYPTMISRSVPMMPPTSDGQPNVFTTSARVQNQGNGQPYAMTRILANSQPHILTGLASQPWLYAPTPTSTPRFTGSAIQPSLYAPAPTPNSTLRLTGPGNQPSLYVPIPTSTPR